MGVSMNSSTLVAFFDEMSGIEKSGFLSSVPKFFSKLPGEAAEATHRIFSPIKGIRKGWKELGDPVGDLTAADRAKYISSGKGHLFNPSTTLSKSYGSGGVKGVSEELSRRGWTGKGKLTKYLPVGQKGLTVGFAGGFGVPSTYEAYKRGPVGPTGESGVGETGLGELAGNSAFIAAGRLGIIPGMAMYTVGSTVGGKAGRIIDRLRSGATLRQAVFSPSPTEAQEQLANISENYTYGNA